MLLYIRRSISLLLASLAALALFGSTASASTASASTNASQRPVTNRDLQPIRVATAKYHNIATALANGYVPFVDINGVSCIAEPGMGGMGVHFVNPALIQDPAIDPRQPEALVYAPERDGTLRLAALEYLVDKVAGGRRVARCPSCSRATHSTRRTRLTGTASPPSTRNTSGPGNGTRRARWPCGTPTSTADARRQQQGRTTRSIR